MTTRDVLSLRGLTRLVRVPILSGPNRALRWSVATRTSFLLGGYEASRCAVIARLAEGCLCFWDLGAHYGYVTLIASRRVAPGAPVYAIEANRDNLWYLRAHVRWNRLQNVRVLPCAMTAKPGLVRFNPVSDGTGFVTVSGGRGSYSVDAASIDDLVARGECLPPAVLKVDIDHRHADLLAGARRTLADRPVVAIVATNNSEAIHRRLEQGFSELNYRVHTPRRCTAFADRSGIESELLAVAPRASVPDDIVSAFLKS
jgi:FkbM family methyltransferase